MMNHKNIKYYNNGGPLGQSGILNGQKCFELSNGEYINYLLHDDVFYPNKIEIMVNYFMDNKDVALVTSSRNYINKNDELVYADNYLPKTIKITGESLGAYMLHRMENVVGEPTTVLFKKADIEDAIFNYKGRATRSYVDMAIWFKLLLKGNAIFIVEPLSSFRIHDTQNTNNPIAHFLGAIDKYYFLTDSYLDKDFIKSKDVYLKILRRWFNIYIGKIKELQNYSPKNATESKELREIKEDLYNCYAQSIKCLITL